MPSPDFDAFSVLLGHDRWATDQLLTVCERVSETDLDREFDIGHRTIRRTFGHYVRATNFWNGQIEGEPVAVLSDPLAIAELRAFHHDVYAQFEARVDQLVAEARLGETFVDFSGTRQRFGTTIVHVTQHNHLHRSEILHMVRRLGVDDLPEWDMQDWEQLRGGA